jgi:SAM-dependent methyltransferase
MSDSNDNRKFSHNDHFSGYMEVIFETIRRDLKAPARILDIPAGFGRIGDKLRSLGHDVVCADINEERTEYVQANMEFRLPFDDASFDVVISMEGVEHVINQTSLINELVRVAKPRGTICISTPNVSNFWSRLTFLFTGYFYQFEPAQFLVAKPDILIDKGHISPITLYHLGHKMAIAGAGLKVATGDRFKKKILFPLALFIFPFSYLMAKAQEKKLPVEMFAETGSTLRYFNLNVFLSRTLITYFVKR